MLFTCYTFKSTRLSITIHMKPSSELNKPVSCSVNEKKPNYCAQSLENILMHIVDEL